MIDLDENFDYFLLIENLDFNEVIEVIESHPKLKRSNLKKMPALTRSLIIFDAKTVVPSCIRVPCIKDIEISLDDLKPDANYTGVKL